jgi:hypothetical protein
MKRDVAPTEDDVVAIRTIDNELHLLSTEQAEQVANRYSDPFRSYIIEAVDEARRDEEPISNIGF